MMDDVRAELAYRQEGVRRDVAATRRDTGTEQAGHTAHAAGDRPENRPGWYRRTGWSAGRRPRQGRPARPARPAGSRVRPRRGNAVR